jgi:predicted Ser/Thr protein kinase
LDKNNIEQQRQRKRQQTHRQAIISPMSALPSPQQLRLWVERSLARQENILAVSNQGIILLFESNDQKLIVKTAMGRGLILKARQRTLLREYQAYLALKGLQGIPQCHGLLDDQFLLLEYIEGRLFRDTELPDRQLWFDDLLEVLRSIHERGVSHGDLKNKTNLMVRNNGLPCVVDFGTAFVFKPGFHPINNGLFRTGKKLDINAWVKHKYHGVYRDASEEDLKLLDYSWLEKLVRRFKGRPMDKLADKN